MRSAHLSEDLLLRHSDAELTRTELLDVENHVAGCEQCRERVRGLSRLSEQLELAVASVPVRPSPSARNILLQLMENRQAQGAYPGRSPAWRWSWSLGLAASLAIVMLFLLPAVRGKRGNKPGTRATTLAALEIDGESFIPLPYSNPDLPISSSRIVQMQVPVSSLADAGIIFEPVSNQAATGDRSVLADVLLGLDGQPLGVHVLEAE